MFGQYFYLVEIQPLNYVKKLESAQFYEDLMLFLLDDGRGALTMVVVSFSRAMANFMRRVVTKLQRPKALAYKSCNTSNFKLKILLENALI